MTDRWRTVEVPFTGTLIMAVFETDGPCDDEVLRRTASDVLADAMASFHGIEVASIDEWVVPEDAPIREIEIREVG